MVVIIVQLGICQISHVSGIHDIAAVGFIAFATAGSANEVERTLIRCECTAFETGLVRTTLPSALSLRRHTYGVGY